MPVVDLPEAVQDAPARHQGGAAHHRRVQPEAEHHGVGGHGQREHAVAAVAHLGGVAGKSCRLA